MQGILMAISSNTLQKCQKWLLHINNQISWQLLLIQWLNLLVNESLNVYLWCGPCEPSSSQTQLHWAVIAVIRTPGTFSFGLVLTAWGMLNDPLSAWRRIAKRSIPWCKVSPNERYVHFLHHQRSSSLKF